MCTYFSRRKVSKKRELKNTKFQKNDVSEKRKDVSEMTDTSCKYILSTALKTETELKLWV